MEKKVWLVTGASSGIGLVLVRELLKMGYRVIAASRTPDRLSAEISIGYDEVFWSVRVDVCDGNMVNRVVKEAESVWGRIDVLVNNAGYEQIGAVEDLTEVDFKKNMDVNLFGAFRFVKAVLPYMRQNQGGIIFNIASIAAYCAWQGSATYSCSKAALDSLSQILAQEVKAWNIQVCSVIPGQFRTDFFDNCVYFENKDTPYSAMYQSKYEGIQQANHRQRGDPKKLAGFLIELSEKTELPIRVFVGEDAYCCANRYVYGIVDDVKRYESRIKELNIDKG